jgi:hypothetical protein
MSFRRTFVRQRDRRDEALRRPGECQTIRVAPDGPEGMQLVEVEMTGLDDGVTVLQQLGLIPQS